VTEQGIVAQNRKIAHWRQGRRMKLLGHCRRCIRSVRRLWREEHGAVAVEFAILTPFLLLIIVGFFSVGVLLIQYQQLNFAVEGGAVAEAKLAGSGVAFASSQISGAQFTATLVPPTPQMPSYACISGQLPVTPVLWQTLTLSAQACSPVPPASTGSPPSGAAG
jgi:Flp pilus assembly protein TadG